MTGSDINPPRNLVSVQHEMIHLSFRFVSKLFWKCPTILYLKVIMETTRSRPALSWFETDPDPSQYPQMTKYILVLVFPLSFFYSHNYTYIFCLKKLFNNKYCLREFCNSVTSTSLKAEPDQVRPKKSGSDQVPTKMSVARSGEKIRIQQNPAPQYCMDL